MSHRFVSVLIALTGLMLMGSASAQELRLDPAKVMGPTACGDCHESSLAAWRGTHHFSTFKEMPRTEDARSIADKLGIKRIKAEGECVSCHFTSKTDAGETDTIAGITCESCHGAGKDWIEVHSDFGGKDATAETESEAHRTTRWAQSEAAGMIRPGNLYALAENCYQCHTVPRENLVNAGGHTAGSDFELVAWSQGEVRHNLWYNDAASNEEASLNRRRVMFLVGQALDLEYALRGVAKATAKAEYAVAMAKRAKRSALRIKAISDAGVGIPEVAALLKIAGSAKVSLNNEAALTAAAEQVAAQGKAIAMKYDGSELAAVDALLPKPDAYKGMAYSP